MKKKNQATTQFDIIHISYYAQQLQLISVL